MGKPSIIQKIQHGLGRAVRETGQALDRVGIKGHQLAVTRRTVGDDPLKYQDHLSRHRQQMPLLKRGKPVVSKDIAFLAPCATLVGTVHIGSGSSVFYKSILRADNCDNAEAFRKSSAVSLEESPSNTSHDNADDTNASELVKDDFENYTPVSDHPGVWDLDPDRSLRINSTATGGGIFIGQDTNIQDGCIIDSSKDHTIIGNGVTVGHLAQIRSATVGDHCLIGMGALLQEGVVVETESFIAAGANVPKNTTIRSGELWVGQPARKIRDLTETERERLHYQANEYVGVASNLQSGMELGGNLLPESLEQYLEYDPLQENEGDFEEGEDASLTKKN